MQSSLHLNVAACYQKIGEYRKSIEACNKVNIRMELVHSLFYWLIFSLEKIIWARDK
jgi:hypothetical protein